MQSGQLGSKIKNAKNLRETILKYYYSCSVQKTAGKNTNYWKNEIILKSRHLAKAIVHAKGLCKMVRLSQKLKMPKTCEKAFYNNITVVLCKKTAGKNTKYWRKETILKSRHLAKAIVEAKPIAFVKWSVWVKK